MHNNPLSQPCIFLVSIKPSTFYLKLFSPSLVVVTMTLYHTQINLSNPFIFPSLIPRTLLLRRTLPVLQMRSPINIQPPLKILADNKLIIRLSLAPQMLHNTHFCIFIRAEEKGHAIPLLAAHIAHTVHRTLPRAARDEFEEIRNVDDKRVGRWVHRDPDAVCVEDLQRGIGSLRLADEREPAEISVCADAHVALGFLRRVVHGTHVGHGMCGYGVEVCLW